MPYSSADDDKLPDNVKDMPKGKREQWVEVWNDTYEACILDDGEVGACETKAFKAANGAVEGDSEEMDRKGVRTLAGLVGGLMDFLKRYMVGHSEEEGEERALSWNDLYSQVWALAYERDPMAWVNDMYDDGEGNTFAIISSQGKLYRADVNVTSNTVSLGDFQEVVIEFVPRSAPPIQIYRKNGQTRALIVGGSSVLNRCGQIDSRELFDNFIKHIESTPATSASPGYGQAPEYGFYHMYDIERSTFGEFRLGVVDWVGREGNLYLGSVLFDDTPLARAAVAAIESDPEHWGNSIGFHFQEETGARELLAIAEGITIPVYRDGINHEWSLLPEGEAAAWFTQVALSATEAFMDKRALDALALIIPDEEARKRFLENAGDVNRSIAERNLVTRDGGDEAESAEDKQEGEAEGPPVVELDDETLDEIAATVLESETVRALVGNITSLRATVDSLKKALETEQVRNNKNWTTAEARLSALEQEEDAKQEQWVADLPRARQGLRVTHRPREVNRAQDPAEEQTYKDIAERTLAELGANSNK